MKRFLDAGFLMIISCSLLTAEEVNMTMVRHFLREMQQMERLQSRLPKENILYLTELPSENQKSNEPASPPVVTEEFSTAKLPEEAEEQAEEKDLFSQPQSMAVKETASEMAEPAILHMDDRHIEPLLPVTHEEAVEEVVPVPVLPSNTPATAELGAVLEEKPEKRPWGVLTLVVFLLLLSISTNFFLGWQLYERRNS